MPARNPKPSVFISHSSKDKPFVRRLVKELEKAGVKVWLDEHKIKPGDSLYKAIGPALNDVNRFLIVLSANSAGSEWVERELRVAFSREIKEKREIIIPVLLEAVSRPPFIEDKKYADFTSEEKFDDSLKELLEVFEAEPVDSTDEIPDDLAHKLFPDFFLPELEYFVGRENLLEQIKTTLHTGHRASIHDFHGIGKTFTAFKFASDNHGDYERIFFIRATKEEMLESLARCGAIVNPELAGLAEQLPKAQGFKQWLELNNKWLVIYDNVDEPEKLSSFVPTNKKGDCLFISNFRGVTHLGKEIKIDKLDKADAEMLLYSRATHTPFSTPKLNGEERAAFDNLITEIDGLPLTLNSTGAFICQNGLTFAEFKKIFEETVWDTEDDFGAYENKKQTKSAGKVFSLVYDKLCKNKKTGTAVKILLDSMCFIAPDEIPADLLLEILKRHYEPFGELENVDVFWIEVRTGLTAYDLLKYDPQKQVFNTHRAIQKVIHGRNKETARKTCESLSEILIDLFPRYDYSNRESCEKYYQHVLTLLENSEKLQVESKETNNLYYRLGRYQELLGNFSTAEKFYARAKKVSAAVFGTESADHATALNNLAIVYRSQGRYDEAIEKYDEALRIDEKTIGKEHPDYATHLNNLGNVYRSQGRYDEAIEKFEQALRIDEKTIGKEHPDYATRLNNLANVYQLQGRYDEAIEKLEQALRIGAKTIGKEHPDYAIHLNNLANVYVSQGRYDEAIEKYEEALRILKKTVPASHPNMQIGENNLKICREKLKNS